MGYIVGTSHHRMSEIFKLPPEEREAALIEHLQAEMEKAETFARWQLRELLDDK
ncbi:MAG TPA: hypothetical protein VKE22_17950 [Haliangiales bacterium]|nr:hypothetical protein [Haliangiales bacterium]